jgi:hypothetical protein|tara:strand:+ start:1713 stop:3026 length:1314 start_codon:yes stop_codon:yes gene_type:complete
VKENKDYRYVGWIPCVNGHLDFGLTKVGIKGGFTTPEHKDLSVIDENLSANGSHADSHVRRIILQSWVDWRDTKLDNENNTIGQFRLFTCGEVNESPDMDERALHATILIYPLDAEPDDLNEKREMPLHNLTHNICKDNIDEQYTKLKALLKEGEHISGLKEDCLKAVLDIKIEPNGLIFLDYENSSSALDADSKYVIARQVYYYIKYSTHSHKHHIDEQDSLTTITTNDSEAPLRLLTQLKRELTTLSRIAKFDNSTHPTNNSLGIIAYSKSLVIACRTLGMLSEEKAQVELERLDNVKESFSALDGSIKYIDSAYELIASKAKVWLGFSLIFLWGISNFLFESAPTKYEIKQAYVVPLAIAILAGVVYHLFTKYYKIRNNAIRVKEIYYLNKLGSSLKIILALCGLICLIWLANEDEPATHFLHIFKTVFPQEDI